MPPIHLTPGGLHGPAIVRGPVCVGEGEASLGPAAGSQVQRHHACSIHDYRKVKTPGYKNEQTPDTIFYPNQVPCNWTWVGREDKLGGSPSGRDSRCHHRHGECAGWSRLWTRWGKEGWEDAGLSQPDFAHRIGKNIFFTIVTNYANQDRMEKLLVERGSQFMVDSLISIFVS